MSKLPNITPTQSNNFDEKFTERFADYVSEHFFSSEHQIKKSLLTAALREQSTAGGVTHSLVAISMRTGFEDNVALELYLRNIDRIEEALLRRNREKTEDATTKASYKKAINESIATLRNVRDGSPAISLGKVLYGMGGQGTSKMIEIDQSGYYEGSIGMEAGDHSYKKNGKGVYIWEDGRRYEGDFRNGARTGQGVLMFTNGDRYEGDFDGNARTGKGVYKWADGDRYKGDFINGTATGQGVYKFVDGTRCEGNFEENTPAGDCSSRNVSQVASSKFRGGKSS